MLVHEKAEVAVKLGMAACAATILPKAMKTAWVRDDIMR